jgi:hypothetical protein
VEEDDVSDTVFRQNPSCSKHLLAPEQMLRLDARIFGMKRDGFVEPKKDWLEYQIFRRGQGCRQLGSWLSPPTNENDRCPQEGEGQDPQGDIDPIESSVHVATVL